MTWYIATVERHRERPFAKEVEAMGFPAWVPLETRYHRNRRKKARSRIWDAPALPGIVFAAVPFVAHGDLQTLRYPCSLMRDLDGYALSVADWQLAAFRAELDKINAHNRRCYNRLMQDKPAGKRRSVKASIEAKLGKATLGNLSEVLAELERLEVLEDAA